MKTKDKVLLIIDTQNDFVSGALSCLGADVVVDSIKELIKSYNADHEIIFTRDTHDENYLDTREGKLLPVPHCIKNTWGWQIVDELSPYIDSYNVVDKTNFGFDEWPAYFYNRDIDPEEIEICGLATDICVISNAIYLRTIYPETTIIVHANACAGTSQELHREALDIMQSCHIIVTE